MAVSAYLPVGRQSSPSVRVRGRDACLAAGVAGRTLAYATAAAGRASFASVIMSGRQTGRGSRHAIRFATLELERIAPFRADALIATFRRATRTVAGECERSSSPLGQCSFLSCVSPHIEVPIVAFRWRAGVERWCAARVPHTMPHKHGRRKARAVPRVATLSLRRAGDTTNNHSAVDAGTLSTLAQKNSTALA